MFRKIIVIICLLGALIIAYVVAIESSGVDPALKSTVNTYVGRDGRIYDPTNNLNFKGIDSVAYKIDGKNLKIYFGTQVFKLKIGKASKETYDYLKRLNISVLSNSKTAEVRYEGKIVKKYE